MAAIAASSSGRSDRSRNGGRRRRRCSLCFLFRAVLLPHRKVPESRRDRWWPAPTVRPASLSPAGDPNGGSVCRCCLQTNTHHSTTRATTLSLSLPSLLSFFAPLLFTSAHFCRSDFSPRKTLCACFDPDPREVLRLPPLLSPFFFPLLQQPSQARKQSHPAGWRINRISRAATRWLTTRTSTTRITPT